MANTKEHVAAASPLVTGGVLWAPKGTPLPTDATTAPDAAFVRLGLVGEDGVTPADEAASVTDLRAWGGEVVASVVESRSITRVDFTLISVFDPDVNKFIYGEDRVTVTPATTSVGTKLAIEETGDEIPAGILLFDMRYKGKRLRRVAPDASAIVTGEAPYADAALMGYTISATLLADADGVRAYRYLENDDLASA